jgi:hypothetical protein
MTISTIYRVHHTVPDRIAAHLRENDAARLRFEQQVSEIIRGNCAAGSDHFDQHEEWAEFTEYGIAARVDIEINRLLSNMWRDLP